MPRSDFSDADLLAYVDEQLPADQSSAVEEALRGSAEMRQRVTLLVRRRDQGGHSIGEIWRRNRLSCPSRSDLGSYLLGAIDPGHEDYIEFHLRTIGCRLCEANLEDLRSAKQDVPDRQRRRRRYFESSAGVLRSQRPS
ncbi:hypothetical protein Mal4_57580 [Maioricimonas rarisocia]|uniref:Uncharacterized protein n=1 Tax=Maioricimonas rarisocia TaxID=2528026 RepID=A0A517ZFZ9_9PLAN|nr:hypothetical protein [Maioricimonas rarisocia]QDU41391.1 hypothetical protein Mal4_57580 [Maioricimonas rarisocia]